MNNKIIILFFLLLPFSVVFAQKTQNLALTPPMGWNSWNKFACTINETIIREMADAMVSSGMNEVGYNHQLFDVWKKAAVGNTGDTSEITIPSRSVMFYIVL